MNIATHKRRMEVSRERNEKIAAKLASSGHGYASARDSREGSSKRPMPKKFSALKSQVTIRNENWKNTMKGRSDEIRDIIKTNRKKPQVQPRVPDFENVQSKVAQTWRRPQT